MGLDRNNIPDEYLCEICKPRQVDRKRAQKLQSRRRNELLLNRSSSSDDERAPTTAEGQKAGKKGQKADGRPPKNSSSAKENKRSQNTKPSVKKAIMKVVSGSLITKKTREGGKVSKKGTDKQPKEKTAAAAGRKRKPSDSKKMPVLIKSRRKSQASLSHDSNVEMDDEDDEDFDLMAPEPSKPIDTASQQLRAWIDQYEEAVTNHYSPELRARLASNKLNAAITSDLKPSVIGSLTRCNVSLQGNGVKVRNRRNVFNTIAI